jgi:hypothetical protein
VIGGIIGGVVAVAIIVLVIFMVWSRKRQGAFELKIQADAMQALTDIRSREMRENSEYSARQGSGASSAEYSTISSVQVRKLVSSVRIARSPNMPRFVAPPW